MTAWGEQGTLRGGGTIRFWVSLEKITVPLALESMWIWQVRWFIRSRKKIPEILIFARDISAVPDSVRYRKTLEEQGKTAENSVFDTLEETLAYARKKGILTVHLVGEEITEYQTGKGRKEDETN